MQSLAVSAVGRICNKRSADWTTHVTDLCMSSQHSASNSCTFCRHTGQPTQTSSQANVGHTWFFLGRLTLVFHNRVCILVATCGASARHIPSELSLSMPRAGI